MLCLDFTSIIIPIHRINEVYKGSLNEFKQEFLNMKKEVLSCNSDENLLAISLHNIECAEFLIDKLETYGFQMVEKVNGKTVGKDFCVYDLSDEEYFYPCNWLLIKYYNYATYIKEGDKLYEKENELYIFYRDNLRKCTEEENMEFYEKIQSILESPFEVNRDLNHNLSIDYKKLDFSIDEIKKYVKFDNRYWKKSVSKYKKLAQGGNAEAYNLLGVIFQDDIEMCKEYFRLAMRGGSIRAIYNLAIKTSNVQEKCALCLQAIEHMEQFERNECRTILCDLAKIYHFWLDKPDREKAKMYYRMAMQDACAANNLAVLLHEEGYQSEAFHLFSFAMHRITLYDDEHKKMENVILRNLHRIEFKGIPMKNIKLCRIGHSFIWNVKQLVKEANRMDNLNQLLVHLPDLQFDPDYVLDDFRSRKQTNSTLSLYARPIHLSRPSDEDFDKHYGYEDNALPF